LDTAGIQRNGGGGGGGGPRGVVVVDSFFVLSLRVAFPGPLVPKPGPYLVPQHGSVVGEAANWKKADAVRGCPRVRTYCFCWAGVVSGVEAD
jgi:hypothetical protein